MIITNVVRHLTKTPFTTNICLCTGLVGQTLRGEGVQVRGVKISMRWQMMRRQFMVWDSETPETPKTPRLPRLRDSRGFCHITFQFSFISDLQQNCETPKTPKLQLKVILKDNTDIYLSRKFDLFQGESGKGWPPQGKGDNLKSLCLFLLKPRPILFTKGRCHYLK